VAGRSRPATGSRSQRGGARDALVHLTERGCTVSDEGTPGPIIRDPLPPLARFPAVAVSALGRWRREAFPAQHRATWFPPRTTLERSAGPCLCPMDRHSGRSTRSSSPPTVARPATGWATLAAAWDRLDSGRSHPPGSRLTEVDSVFRLQVRSGV
jgi:hypothetical protein